MTINIAETYDTAGIGTHHAQQVIICYANSTTADETGLAIAIVEVPEDSFVLSGGWYYQSTTEAQRAFTVSFNGPTHLAGITDYPAWGIFGYIPEGAPDTSFVAYAICAKLI